MKKGMGWPIGMALLLLATVGGNLAVIVLTGDDPSFAVEPDYYRKAVDWDSTAAVRAQSDRIGWQLDVTMEPAAGDSTQLRFTLRDSTGAAVRGARVHASMLHVARAGDVWEVDFAERAGWYEARVAMQRDGVWELRVSADRGSELFRSTVRVETGRPPGDAGTE